MPKILTPVNLGSFVLSHRVITVVAPSSLNHTSGAEPGQITAGGLVIHSYAPGLSRQALTDEQASGRVAARRSFNDAIRLNGGTNVARCTPSGITTQPGGESPGERSSALGGWAVLAQQAGFNGAELDASTYPALQSAEPLLDAVQDIIAVWGPERVGVQLGPFAWMSQFDDTRLADFYCQLIGSLVEMEIAYVHMAGAYAQDRGDLSLSPIGRRLRHIFPGMLIASGEYTPAGAIAAVESRWADAVAFTMMMGDGATLLAAIRSAGSTPPEGNRRIRDRD